MGKLEGNDRPSDARRATPHSYADLHAGEVSIQRSTPADQQPATTEPSLVDFTPTIATVGVAQRLERRRARARQRQQ